MTERFDADRRPRSFALRPEGDRKGDQVDAPRVDSEHPVPVVVASAEARVVEGPAQRIPPPGAWRSLGCAAGVGVLRGGWTFVAAGLAAFAGSAVEQVLEERFERSAIALGLNPIVGGFTGIVSAIIAAEAATGESHPWMALPAGTAHAVCLMALPSLSSDGLSFANKILARWVSASVREILEAFGKFIPRSMMVDREGKELDRRQEWPLGLRHAWPPAFAANAVASVAGQLYRRDLKAVTDPAESIEAAALRGGLSGFYKVSDEMSKLFVALRLEGGVRARGEDCRKVCKNICAELGRLPENVSLRFLLGTLGDLMKALEERTDSATAGRYVLTAAAGVLAAVQELRSVIIKAADSQSSSATPVTPAAYLAGSCCALGVAVLAASIVAGTAGSWPATAATALSCALLGGIVGGRCADAAPPAAPADACRAAAHALESKVGAQPPSGVAVDVEAVVRRPSDSENDDGEAPVIVHVWKARAVEPQSAHPKAGADGMVNIDQLQSWLAQRSSPHLRPLDPITSVECVGPRIRDLKGSGWHACMVQSNAHFMGCLLRRDEKDRLGAHLVNTRVTQTTTARKWAASLESKGVEVTLHSINLQGERPLQQACGPLTVSLIDWIGHGLRGEGEEDAGALVRAWLSQRPDLHRARVAEIRQELDRLGFA